VPKSVRIGPLRWRITTSLGSYNAFAAAENDGKALGFSQLETLTIVLKPGLPDSLLRETLLHELLHAIIQTQGGVFDVAKEEEHEEAAVAAISPLLLSTLRANEDVLEFILGD
jgi:hypothetical protein